MVLGFAAVLALAAAPGFSQAPSRTLHERAVKQLMEERARVILGQADLFLAPRRNFPAGSVVESGTACAIPLLEMPIDKRAIPLVKAPPLRRSAPMPQFHPRVCPKR